MNEHKLNRLFDNDNDKYLDEEIENKMIDSINKNIKIKNKLNYDKLNEEVIVFIDSIREKLSYFENKEEEHREEVIKIANDKLKDIGFNPYLTVNDYFIPYLGSDDRFLIPEDIKKVLSYIKTEVVVMDSKKHKYNK